MPDSVKDNWKEMVVQYSHPQRWRSIWQLIDTLVLYVFIWVMMYFSLRINYWLTVLLALIGAGLLVRLFIFFHDCGHGSFFASRKANTFWGYVLGVLIFTPCDLWWHEHAIHHASAGNLDKRGVGDIWTLTAQEYLRASRWTRIKYCLARNPVCLFLIGAPVMFIVLHRFPKKGAAKKELANIHLTNLGIVIMAFAISMIIGFKNYLFIQLPMSIMASSVGIWLFYVQHQFEGVYWRRTPEWDFVEESLLGASFYKLPSGLQWFSGNIGFHHIHHLGPRIPNYSLEQCYTENPLFHIKPLTLLSSLKTLGLRVWDEQNRQLISFREMRKRLGSGLISI